MSRVYINVECIEILEYSQYISKYLSTLKMNKSILLVILPCIIAMAFAQMYVNTADPAYKYYYNNQYNAYRQQTGLYRAGGAAQAQLKSARLLNYLFGFLLLLDLTNVTGNSLTTLG